MMYRRFFLLAMMGSLLLAACEAIPSVPTPPALEATASPTPAITAAPAQTDVPVALMERRFLFASDEGGNWDIYLIHADGSNRVNLTNHPADDQHPTWSPDGQRIAFYSNRDGQGQIYTMYADGSAVAPVPDTGALDVPVGWSPDGRYLLLHSLRNLQPDVYAVALDGSGSINLTPYPAENVHAAWSPDGEYIVFSSDRDSGPETPVYQIYRLHLESGEIVRLTEFPMSAISPIWSPDGRQIAMSVNRGELSGTDVYQTGGSDVYIMDADGSNPRQLTNYPSWNYPQHWSADGDWLLVNTLAGANRYEFAVVTVEGERILKLPITQPQAKIAPSGELSPPLTLAISTPTPEPSSTQSLALVNGILIDGTGAAPLPDAALVIQDGYITAVGSSSEVVVPDGSEEIDVQGATILPGFVNAHVHQTMNARNLAAWAQAGVTTVRDLAAQPSSLAFAYWDATYTNPHYARVVSAGPIVTAPGGYPIDYHGAEIALVVDGPEDARRKVSALLDEGAHVVKIALEGNRRLSGEEVAAIVEIAHERGTIVTAHVSTAHHLALGVEAGIDDAAHIAITSMPDELIAQLVADDVYIVPTLEAWNNHGMLGAGTDNLRRFVAAGGKVALGDDYGNPGIELGMPLNEMGMMGEAGMTPMQIIIAATQHGAEVSNLGDELGTLEPGKIADVLVVDGDPLRNLGALRNVQWVLKSGVVIRAPEN